MVAVEAVKIIGAPELLVGVDPSAGMLERARAALPAAVHLIKASAEAIPFPDASFDFLSMGYALRHIGDLEAAFREFHRVLKPGGRLCLLEITKPETIVGRALLKTYMRGIVPTLARVVGAGSETARLWRYYWDTIETCASPRQVVATLSAVGFEEARRYVDQRSMSIFAEFQARKAG
jgi:demethylmenaquinone methyltransferase/2-methoxy-6-polyprenyl-1,4-benzoquinol methylase